MKIENLFSNIPSVLNEELFEEIDKTGAVKIERIINKKGEE